MALLGAAVERTDDFARRTERMQALVDELRERTALVARGGGERAIERHRSRGKLLARERIDRLVDPGTRVPRAERARGLGRLRRRGAQRPGSSPASASSRAASA